MNAAKQITDKKLLNKLKGQAKKITPAAFWNKSKEERKQIGVFMTHARRVEMNDYYKKNKEGIRNHHKAVKKAELRAQNMDKKIGDEKESKVLKQKASNISAYTYWNKTSDERQKLSAYLTPKQRKEFTKYYSDNKDKVKEGVRKNNESKKKYKNNITFDTWKGLPEAEKKEAYRYLSSDDQKKAYELQTNIGGRSERKTIVVKKGNGGQSAENQGSVEQETFIKPTKDKNGKYISSYEDGVRYYEGRIKTLTNNKGALEATKIAYNNFKKNHQDSPTFVGNQSSSQTDAQNSNQAGAQQNPKRGRKKKAQDVQQSSTEEQSQTDQNPKRGRKKKAQDVQQSPERQEGADGVLDASDSSVNNLRADEQQNSGSSSEISDEDIKYERERMERIKGYQNLGEKFNNNEILEKSFVKLFKSNISEASMKSIFESIAKRRYSKEK